LGINFGFVDIFLNIPWEFKFYDSWLDLAVLMALLSSYENKIISSNNVFFGEVSLSWKVGKTKFHTKREKEAQWFDIIDYKVVKNIKDLRKFI